MTTKHTKKKRKRKPKPPSAEFLALQAISTHLSMGNVGLRSHEERLRGVLNDIVSTEMVLIEAVRRVAFKLTDVESAISYAAARLRERPAPWWSRQVNRIRTWWWNLTSGKRLKERVQSDVEAIKAFEKRMAPPPGQPPGRWAPNRWK
jgi:hypothetical protein